MPDAVYDFYIGIDPGVSGGLAVLASPRAQKQLGVPAVSVWKTPTVTKAVRRAVRPKKIDLIGEGGPDGSTCEAVVAGGKPQPKTKKGEKKVLAPEEMAMLLRPYGIGCEYGGLRAFALIEFANPRPGEGAFTAQSSGFGVGLWCGMLAAMKIGRETVTAMKWKGYYNLPGKDKKPACQKAMQLFPEVADAVRHHTTQDGPAEALLIAEYCRRLYEGSIKTPKGDR